MTSRKRILPGQRRHFSAGLLSLVLCVLAVQGMGCATHTTRTARQLEAGDVVISGSLDELGTIYIPRLNVQAMYGLGGSGDVSVHGGSSGLVHNVGLGARGYLGRAWTFGVQANTMAFQDAYLFSARDVTFLHHGSFLLSTAARRKTALYGGLLLDVYAMRNDSLSAPVSDVFVNGGGLIGLDMLDHGGLGYQLELKLTPFFFHDRGFSALSFFDSTNVDNSIFSAQLGVSIYRRVKTRELAIEPSESVWLDEVEKEIEQRRLHPEMFEKKQGAPAQEREAPMGSSSTTREPSGTAPVPPKPE